MATVYSAVHRESGHPVALKVLTSERMQDRVLAEALQAEVRAVAGLDHPNVIWVHDTGRATESSGAVAVGSPWYAMELLRGGTLGLHHAGSFTELRELLLGVLDALAHAHSRGVLHRDLKPANVLFGAGVDPSPTLSDFGLALRFDEPTSALRGGSRHWVAPEQIRNELHAQGPWTDLYALGCIAFALATGQRPFAGRDPMRQHLEAPMPALEPRWPVPPGLGGWIGGMMRKEPALRFQAAADAAWALEQLEPAGTHEVTPARVRPPVPTSWSEPAAPRPPVHLHGAGLGLYGLRAVPVVGRHGAQQTLWTALLEATESSAPRVVVLRGPSGCGKSHLARWLAQRAEEVGAAVSMVARHSPEAAHTDGIAPMIARCHRVDAVPPGALFGVLGARLARAGSDDRDWEAGALAGLLRPGDAGTDEIRLETARARHEVLRRELARLRSGRTAVVWLDDAQWGLDSVRFASLVAGDPASGPVLLVLTARDEELPVRPDCARALEDVCGGATVVTLGPLGGEDRRRLVRRLLPLTVTAADEVDRRTAGNPLFATQLLGDWVDRGLLVPTAGGFALRPGQPLPLPASLAETWRDRIERLLGGAPASWRDAIEISAVLGQEFREADLLATCRAAGVGSPRDALAALAVHRLVTRDPAGATVTFVHGMLREVLLARADARGTARRWHGVAAQMLADTGPTMAAQRAQHLEGCGDLDAAIDAWLAAREHSERTDGPQKRWALERALACLEARADEDDPRWPVARYLRFVAALRTDGDPASARRLLEDDRGGPDVRLERLAEHALMKGRDGAVDEAIALSRELVRAAADRPYWRLRGNMRLGVLLSASGRLGEAVEVYRAAIALEPERSLVRIELCETLVSAGRLDEAKRELAILEARSGASRSARDRRLVAEVRAYLLQALGDQDGAVASLTGARRLLARTGGSTVLIDLNLATLHLQAGAPERADRALTDSGFEAWSPYHQWAGRLVSLAVAAQLGDWARFHRIEVEDHGYADASMARLLEDAGERAQRSGIRRGARKAWGLALLSFERLGRHDDARRVRDRMV